MGTPLMDTRQEGEEGVEGVGVSVRGADGGVRVEEELRGERTLEHTTAIRKGEVVANPHFDNNALNLAPLDPLPLTQNLNPLNP
jgi:hypothetical protein